MINTLKYLGYFRELLLCIFHMYGYMFKLLDQHFMVKINYTKV